MRLSFIAWCVVLAACAEPAKPAITASLGEKSVAFVDSVGFLGPSEWSGAPGLQHTVAGAIVSNLPGTCEKLRASPKANASFVLIVVAIEGATPPSAGTYHVHAGAEQRGRGLDGREAVVDTDAMFVTDDGSGMSTHQSTGGTITLTNVSSASIDGNFDLVFTDGGHVAGSFSSPICEVDWRALLH